MRVLIAGAGIGGLALAQGLRRAGVDVTVFERDPSPTLRQQGYRIHIDGQGGAALEACLPPELFELYLSTSDNPSGTGVTILDHRLRELNAFSFPPGRHTAVNRLTLRQILLHGLDDVVRFGHEVTGASTDGDGVRLEFEGGSAIGDVLIGADGTGSVVRPHAVPAAAVVDTGMFGIYGRTPLPPGGFPGLPGGFSAVTGTGTGATALALSSFQARHPVAEAGAAAGVPLAPVPDYQMWCALTFERPEGDATALHRKALGLLEGWHETVYDIVARAEVPATFPVTIRTSQRIPAWPTSNITLLGDAIHAMTPAGGVGANTALRDAARLTAALSTADSPGEVHDAIAAYESDMRVYGFAAVEASLKGLR